MFLQKIALEGYITIEGCCNELMEITVIELRIYKC